MSITFGQAAQRVGAAATSIGGAGSERALVAAGMDAKKVMAGAARLDTGGDGTLSRFGRGRQRGRIRAEARFDQQVGKRIVVSPSRRSRGLWALLQFGSAGSTWTYPRRRGRRRTAGTYTRPPVPARRAWSQAQPAAAAAAFTAYRKSLVGSTVAKLQGRR